MKSKFLFLVIIALMLQTTAVSGHTPLDLDHDNHSPEEALEIPNPTKSWAMYRELHGPGEPEYFRLDLNSGERLLISVFVPVSEAPGFAPDLVVMGKGLPSEGSVPGYIEIPDGYGAVVVGGKRSDEPEYEPFSPGSQYFVARYDNEVEKGGVYYFALSDESGGGKYGVAVGYREVFTLLEWVTIPLDIMEVRIWEGQNLLIVYAPLIASLILGYVYIFRRTSMRREVNSILGVASGLLHLGTGFTYLLQTAIAASKVLSGLVGISVIIGLIPIIIGILLLKATMKQRGPFTTRDRIKYAFLGVVGFFSWGGFLIGPTLALLVSIFPKMKAR